jgi:hypothetical protein
MVRKPQKSKGRSSYLKEFIFIIAASFLVQNNSAQINFQGSPSLFEFASLLTDTSKINISAESITLFASDGSKASVTIITGKSWNLKCSEEWLSADVRYGTGVTKVVIKADENNATVSRSAYVTIYVDGLPLQKINIFQKARHEE